MAPQKLSSQKKPFRRNRKKLRLGKNLVHKTAQMKPHDDMVTHHSWCEQLAADHHRRH